MAKYRGTPKKLIDYLYEQDKEKVFEIDEYKEKRNNRQNARYWSLLGELSLVLKIGVEELHFEMLRNYSQRYEICVPTGTKLTGIDYYEKKSSIVSKNGSKFDTYYVYTPSHELNMSEFAILLNGLIEECKNVGIDTRSPEEIKKDEGLYNGLKSNIYR